MKNLVLFQAFVAGHKDSWKRSSRSSCGNRLDCSRPRLRLQNPGETAPEGLPTNRPGSLRRVHLLRGQQGAVTSVPDPLQDSSGSREVERVEILVPARFKRRHCQRAPGTTQVPQDAGRMAHSTPSPTCAVTRAAPAPTRARQASQRCPACPVSPKAQSRTPKSPSDLQA